MQVYTVPAAAHLQRLNTRRLMEFEPESTVEWAIKRIMAESQRHAIKVTHKDTGALSRSHMTEIQKGRRNITGTLSLSSNVRNPKHNIPTYIYGVDEHDRGDSHAFYNLTFFDSTIPAADRAFAMLGRRVRWR